MISSGLRIGTPALATRGFGPAEFAEVADIIATTLVTPPTGRLLADLRSRIAILTAKFPLYPNL